MHLSPRIIPFFIFCLLLVTKKPAAGQTRLPDSVEINLAGRSISGTKGKGIPFNIPFSIYGKADSLDKIELYYRIQPSELDREMYYLLDSGNKTTNYTIQGIDPGKNVTIISDGQRTLLKIVCPRIRPNQQNPLLTGFSITIKNGGKDPFRKLVKSDTIVHIALRGNQLADHRKSAAIYPIQYKTTSWHYLPAKHQTGPDGYIKEPLVWERLSSGETHFRLAMGAMHPNVMYDFKIVALAAPALSAQQMKSMKAELISDISRHYTLGKINEKTGKDDSILNQRVAIIVKKHLDKRGSLVDSSQQPFVINMQDAALKTVKDSLLNANKNNVQTTNIKKSIITNLMKSNSALLESNIYKKVIIPKLNSILRSKSTLSPGAAVIWDSTLLGKITVKQVAGIVIRSADLAGILKKEKYIDTLGAISSLTKSSPPDAYPFSIGLISRFFEEVTSTEFKATGGNVIFELSDSYYSHFYHTIQELNTAIRLSDKGAASYQTDLLLVNKLRYLADPGSKIKEGLHPVVHNKLDNISEATKTLLATKLNPAIQPYTDMKVQDAAMLVYNSFNNPQYFNELLSGSAVIDATGTSITYNTTNVSSLPTYQVLLSFFRLINSPAFTQKDGSQIFAASRFELNFMVSQFELAVKQMQQYETEQKNIPAVSSALADMLADTYIRKSYLLPTSSVINMNIEARKNPYIGLDIGFGYAPWAHTALLHEGLNIYLAPINKDVPLSSLYGRERFLNMFSIFIGLSQKVTSSEVNDQYQDLFSGLNSSFLAGVGIRFNRLMRLNAAALIYRRKDLNPIISSSSVSITPCFTLAIDTEFAKLFSKIGTIFP